MNEDEIILEDEGFIDVTIGHETKTVDIDETFFKICEATTNSGGDGFSFDEEVRLIIASLGFTQKLSARAVRLFNDKIGKAHEKLEKKFGSGTSPMPPSWNFTGLTP